MDGKNKVARSNVYADFGKILKAQIKNNEDYKVVFARAGLSDMEDKYELYLTPYWYNRGYRNDNEDYNPEYACLSLCQELEKSDETLVHFFNVILENTKKIDEDIIESLERYLEVMGLELRIEEQEKEYWNEYKYSLIPLTRGAEKRKQDLDLLSTSLDKTNPQLFKLYNEAINNYGNGNYVSCIENCRSLFEAIFKRLDPVSKNYAKGILQATKEKVVENGAVLDSRNKIFNYWLNNNQGANRYRLFMTLYSVMSGLGTHKEDTATMEDALMLLRFTEDVLIWCCQKGIV